MCEAMEMKPGLCQKSQEIRGLRAKETFRCVYFLDLKFRSADSIMSLTKVFNHKGSQQCHLENEYNICPIIQV